MSTAISSWVAPVATTCSASRREETNQEPNRATLRASRSIFSQSQALADGFSFAGPKGIAVASDGAVYVTGTGGASDPAHPHGLNDDVVGIFPDGTTTELVNRDQLGVADWNPQGIAIDERSGAGVFVYATGPVINGGGLVRIAPDLTVTKIFETDDHTGGLGLVVDELGTVYLAYPGQPGGKGAIYQIPDARNGKCGEGGKLCSALVSDGEPDCDGNPVLLDQPYALALAGGILYATAQKGNNVVRLPLPNNPLGLRPCPRQIFPDGDTSLRLDTPRALAADNSGNVYAAGSRSGNVIWIKPDPANDTKFISQEIINRTAGIDVPLAVALDSQGNVYVSGNITSNVFRIRTIHAGLECGNGTRDTGEACEYTLDCCCSVSCNVQEAGGLCRGAAGDCDVTDVCDGVKRNCVDARHDSSTVCRRVAGLLRCRRAL